MVPIEYFNALGCIDCSCGGVLGLVAPCRPSPPFHPSMLSLPLLSISVMPSKADMAPLDASICLLVAFGTWGVVRLVVLWLVHAGSCLAKRTWRHSMLPYACLLPSARGVWFVWWCWVLRMRGRVSGDWVVCAGRLRALCIERSACSPLHFHPEPLRPWCLFVVPVLATCSMVFMWHI